MNLVWVKLHGYKRFQDESDLNVDGKVVAIVGPNEAGKSSLLHALEHLNPNAVEGFTNSGAIQDLTRGIVPLPEQPIIGACFQLEADDYEALSALPSPKDARWFIFEKTANRGFKLSIKPELRRDLQLRKEVRQDLNQAIDKLKTEKELQEHVEIFINVAKDLLNILDLKTESLQTDQIESIRALSHKIENEVDSIKGKYFPDLPQKLLTLIDQESAAHPNEIAKNILNPRRPIFLFFSDNDRHLAPEYSLDQNTFNNPPAALQNVTKLANLDLEELRIAFSTNDQGKVGTLEERANNRLKELFNTVWSQSDISVRLRINNNSLYILVGNIENTFTSIAERSDGLRQYVALLAFLNTKQAGQNSILLIDEAETHLHYDAQADLIQMFARQDAVNKIIYTTHSIGCLPEDIGTGVRQLKAEGTKSSCVNWFWEESPQSGFSPLLFGMGATTLSFVTLRNAVITEGACDFLLFPSLFREVTNLLHLNFQVVPGLSNADTFDIGILQHSSPRTIFLVDNDQGGRELENQLRSANIPDYRIFHLPKIDGGDSVIEDFINTDTYLSAVNKELNRSYGSKVVFPADEMPKTLRPTVLNEWLKTLKKRELNKRAIVYHLLEAKSEAPILAEEYKSTFQELYNSMISALEKSRSEEINIKGK